MTQDACWNVAGSGVAQSCFTEIRSIGCRLFYGLTHKVELRTESFSTQYLCAATALRQSPLTDGSGNITAIVALWHYENANCSTGCHSTALRETAGDGIGTVISRLSDKMRFPSSSGNCNRNSAIDIVVINFEEHQVIYRVRRCRVRARRQNLERMGW